MKNTNRAQDGSLPTVFYYGMYILSMLIFGTNGYIAAHISFQGSQVVLLRTLIGGGV
jgi:hypothetical protein